MELRAPKAGRESKAFKASEVLLVLQVLRDSQAAEAPRVQEAHKDHRATAAKMVTRAVLDAKERQANGERRAKRAVKVKKV